MLTANIYLSVCLSHKIHNILMADVKISGTFPEVGVTETNIVIWLKCSFELSVTKFYRKKTPPIKILSIIGLLK